LKISTHEEFCKEVFNRFGDKVKILSIYTKINDKINIEYICDKHGIVYNNYSASTLLYSNEFQPCKQCSKDKLSLSTRDDLSGKIFRSWMVTQYVGNSKWECCCIHCGSKKIIKSQMLKKDQAKDCICRDYTDIIGTKVGKLTILGCVKKNKFQQSILCLCECGNKKYINISDLKKKNPTKSCGCLSKERTEKVKKEGMIDIVGNTYGKWTVIKYSGDGYWLCRCECGKEKLHKAGTLTSGQS
jgi:hypothetical protein